MKAVRIHQTGPASVLLPEEIPNPTPGPGEVLVRLEAIGVNYIDVYHRTGLYRLGNLPLTLGVEGAGAVEAVGGGVTDLAAGQRVAFAGPAGAYAEKAVVPADRLVPLPEGVSSEAAAAVLLQGLTAHYLTRSTFHLTSEHACLVHAAAGGVGLLLCQMARSLGARVIATTSSPEKAELAREAGADEVILYTRSDFQTEVSRLTGGAGVDVVYDGVGQATFEGSLGCLRPRGMLVLFGQASGPVPPFEPSVLSARGSLFLTRPSLFHYIASRQELLDRACDVFSALRASELSVRVSETFPLDRAAAAHETLEARRSTGKLLLRP